MTERSIVPRLDASDWAWMAVAALAFANSIVLPLLMVGR